MLQAIEVALSPLPVLELPQDELVQIAEAARDRLHDQAQRAQEAADALAARKRALIEYGLRYAREALDEVEDLGALERWQIDIEIKRELEELTGRESHASVEELVDDILDREGIGDDDEAEDFD
jgi:hypothetical protein